MLSTLDPAPVSTNGKPPRLAAATGRGRMWLQKLSEYDPQPVLGTPSVLCGEVMLGDVSATALAVVPDPSSKLPRARHGEFGLEQAWALAACIHALVDADRGGAPRPIVAVVDTPGQAFGRLEEQRGLSMACAASIEAYHLAREAGHTVLTLVVGRAISGSFLAHGLQSDAILALAGPGVSMHAMSAPSIARVTRRTLAEVQAISASVLPMSYDIEAAYRLGIIDELLEGIDADAPKADDVDKVRKALAGCLQRVAHGGTCKQELVGNSLRAGTLAVRETMQAQWAAAESVLSAR